MSGRRSFRAPYDAIVLGITIVLTPFLLLAAFAVTAGVSGVLGVASGFGILLIPLGSFLFAPTGYDVEHAQLRIRRPAGVKVIPLHDLVAVGPYERCGHVHLRGWRVGGLFGVYGRFRTGHGVLEFWGRRLKPMVGLTVPDGVVVVMPDDPEAFVAACEAYVPGSPAIPPPV
jgi:hypothetical protein